MTDSQPLVARFENVIIGSRVGDAMGTPTEALEPVAIEQKFGWVTEFEGDGTDDSLMATVLAGALITTSGRAGIDDWADALSAGRAQILAKRDKFFPSVLHLIEKLDSGYAPSQVAHGNMPSSSSAMCIWPVGLVHAGDPDSAAKHAYELAGLIHTGEVDHCTDAAAAVAAAVAAALIPGATMSSAIAAALDAIRPRSGAVMKTAISDALSLASSSGTYESFRADYHAKFLQTIFCDSLETVPATFALCRLAEGDLQSAVEFGANFGRDTDTIASMAGAICGALAERTPEPWRLSLGPELVSTATELAGELVGAARSVATSRMAASRTIAELHEGAPNE